MVLGYDEYIKLTDTMDEYGLGMFETLELLKLAENLCKKGVITDEKLGGRPIRFDNYESLAEWFDNIAYGRGFGNVLAEGFRRVLEEYGEYADYAPCVVKSMAAYQNVRGAVFSKTFTPFEPGTAVHPRSPPPPPAVHHHRTSPSVDPWTGLSDTLIGLAFRGTFRRESHREGGNG